MATHWLPDSIAITPVGALPYAYYVDEPADDRGYIRCAERSIFHPLTMLDIERAEDNRYVHIRFHHNNKYWQRQNSPESWIVAISNQPIEDTSIPSCTLFEPSLVQITGTSHALTLRHVQSQRQVRLRGDRLFCEPGGATALDFVNLQTVIKLPARVSFKGDNNLFLRAVTIQSQPHLQFSSTDPNERECAFEIKPNNDGHIRIKSTHLACLYAVADPEFCLWG